MDEILDKVNREGLRNLTRRERNFLKSASKRYKKKQRLILTNLKFNVYGVNNA